MCGICGFYGFEDKALLKDMIRILSHRGPDDHGIYTDKNISLGHTRLSIVDLSKAGHQPMSNEDNSLWLTYNGEIYNFRELRAELEKHGHRFKSNTDTEIIIHAYEQYGEKCVERFNGMFAFALWDTKKRTLFLARDRLGVKPLYYFHDKERFIFASELKAILLHGSIKREVNRSAAYSYLNLRYIPGEETLFKGIKKLLPGLTLTIKGKQAAIRQYWDLPLPENRHDAHAEENVRAHLIDSIKKRLIADVPVGVYLSGGIDSASIVALASQLKDEPVKTFSVGFNTNDGADELDKAKLIADRFGTDHHEIVMESSVSALLPRILWHMDMPHGDPVVIPQLKLSELAAKKVKVVLSGDGADEIFGGYVQYRTMMLAKKIRYIPSSVAKLTAQVSPIKILDKFFDYPSSIGEKGKEKLMDLIGDIKDEKAAYLDLVSIMSRNDQKTLLKMPDPLGLPESHLMQEHRSPIINRMLYYDTKVWLPNYILQVNDRMTMASSIEGRVPFLDYRLVEYANSLSPSMKANKAVLRKAMSNMLPKQITAGRKHAFFMPLDNWFKDELKGLAEQLFTPDSVSSRGYFEYNALKKIWENYHSSKLLYGKQLFTIINFELWHRMFIDAEKIPKDGNIKLKALL